MKTAYLAIAPDIKLKIHVVQRNHGVEFSYSTKLDIKKTDSMQLELPLTAMISSYRKISSLNGSSNNKQQSSKKVILFHLQWMKATPKLGVNIIQNGWEGA